ncbi:Glycosyltransferase involved in cell wall bisynthesis [Microbacterium pygmaeum]|uniref:D-inositol 3-phosphate glycosyltransferase n=1 Tax=Microbacterium pygmaeum TaxID=370764 RepID=A0A1G8CQE8_9MICO|nr:Glycosyltransferase involved in cell wall bisynthesis [Microbacterium pygmaeum]
MQSSHRTRSKTVAVAFDLVYPQSKGGGERYYRGLAEELARTGRDVDYLTSDQPSSEAEPQNIRLVAVSAPLRLYDEAGVRRWQAAVHYTWGLFRTLVRSRRSYGSVIVSSTPVLNVFAARAALLGSGTRVVVDYLEVWDRPKWIEYAGRITGFIAWLLQRAAIWITPAATCHAQLTARRLRGEGYRGPLAISPGLIDGIGNPGALTAASRPPFVLYAGRHIADKQIEFLPAAVEEVRRTIPDLELVILGRGSHTDTILEAVGDRDWVSLPGFVDEEELRHLFSTAACLANPSRREGYGLVVVEAAAWGTPVVLVSDENNASTELIAEGVNGFVAASTAPGALGAAIMSVLQGGEELRHRTREWYEEAVRTRTIEKTVQGILPMLDGATRAGSSA